MKFRVMGDRKNPVFENCNHMQMQILDPEGFAKMMDQLIRTGGIDNLYFRRKEK